MFLYSKLGIAREVPPSPHGARPEEMLPSIARSVTLPRCCAAQAGQPLPLRPDRTAVPEYFAMSGFVPFGWCPTEEVPLPQTKSMHGCLCDLMCYGRMHF